MAAPVRDVYYVAHDVVLPSGGRLCDVMLSREIKRVGVLRRVYKRIQRRVPKAFMVESRQYR